MSRNAAQVAQAKADWAVISIADYFQAPAALQEGWFDILRLSFYDQEMAIPGMKLFPEEQVDMTLSFIERVAPHVQGILVHCNKGISRSAAVAKYIAERYRLEFPTEYYRYNFTVFDALCDRADVLQAKRGHT